MEFQILSSEQFPSVKPEESLLAIARLEATCPRAVEIIKMCAFLAPTEIPEELFTGPSPVQEQETSREAIECLLAASLLSRQQDTRALSVHPLLQDALRATLGTAEYEQSLERVAVAFYHYLRSVRAATATTFSSYLTHIWQISHHYEIGAVAGLEIAALFSWGATLFARQAAYTEAESLFQFALAIRERKLGRNHRGTVGLLHELGVVKARLGRYDEARALLLEASATRSQILGSTHADTLQSLSELAALLHTMGKSTEAAETYQKALALAEQAGNPDFPVLLALLQQLAQLFVDVARLSEAEALLQKAYTLAENNAEIGAGKTRELLAQLALIAQAQEKWEQAESLLRHLTSIWESAREQEHPEALAVQSQLVQVLIARAQWEQAEALARRLLSIQQRVLGSEHQETIQTLEHLALLATIQGRSAEAQALTRPIQQIREREARVGEPSEAIIGLLGQVGLLIAQQDFEQTIPLLEKALDLCSYLPPGDELARSTVLQALAIARVGLEQYPQALDALRQASEICEHLLGPEHLMTRNIRQQIQALAPQFPGGFGE